MTHHTTQTPDSLFRLEITHAMPAVRTAAARLWQAPGLDRRYPAYLRSMHGVLRSSVPLMEFAARRCAELDRHDPIAEPLRDYLELHIIEERGHDDWLLEDLAVLGVAPDQVLSEPPLPSIARLVGPQYYWIGHYHPVVLLGYIAVLESNAPAEGLAPMIASSLGIPAEALRTVREHAALDTGHADAVLDLLDRLPLTPLHRRAVGVSGLHTASALIDLFAELVRGPVPRQAVSHPPASPGSPNGVAA